jgi:hypothetical protein
MQRSLILITALLSGCASSAAVRGDKRLPVRNVVLYRSGVGYFERAGTFDGEAIEFHVKQSEVGDFLASLTAVERTSGSVRSVSFEVPEQPTLTPVPEGAPAPKADDPRVDVKLAFGSEREHDLTVAYVVGSPVWRPSYRVVFDPQGQALLQAWAVVQNTSGEDWRDIKLSLTTGAPISFRSDLGTPITPTRPLVTDSGEVIDYVPTGETVIDQQPPAPPRDLAAEKPSAPMPAPSMAEQIEEEWDESAAVAQSSAPARRQAGKRAIAEGSVGGGGMAERGQAASMDAAGMQKSVQTRVSATVLTESVTRYDLSEPVTIPNGGSTMVAIVSKRVPGEQAHLFAPEGGVPLSHQHPFSVARLKNDTGAVLEKGPVALLADGAFLGQGLLDTLPRDAQAFVPFALDKSIVVEPAEHWSEEQGSLVRVIHGVITVQSFSQRKTQYRLRNGGAANTKVYLRHQRWGQAELVKPPEGTELAPDKALVPVTVPAHGQAELDVIERTPVELQLTIMDSRAADALQLYLSGPAASAPQSAELKKALALRAELTALEQQIGAAQQEQHEVTNAANEARRNLKAIEKLATAKDLRASIFERLKGYDARAGELTKKLIEARTKQAEQQVRLNELLEGLTLQP